MSITEEAIAGEVCLNDVLRITSYFLVDGVSFLQGGREPRGK